MSYSPRADHFLRQMPRLVTLTPYTVTGTGQRVMGTPRQYHARIEATIQDVYSATGQIVNSTGLVLMHPKALDGTVLLTSTPDAVLDLGDGRKPRILAIGSTDDATAIVYWTIHI